MQPLKFFVVVFTTAVTVSARLLKKPIAPIANFNAKKTNFADVLVGINRKIKAGLQAQLVSGQPPAFSQDIFGCALTIKNGIEDLRMSYTEVHTPTVIAQACEYSNVYLELGKNKQKCDELLQALEEERSGDQNYHRWCRKVAASESEYMKKAMKKMESDPESKKLLGECQKDCPSIAKIIKEGAAISELKLEMMQPPPPGTKFEDVLKELVAMDKKVMTHTGAICDHHAKKKCTLQNMHGACTAMFEKVGVPLPMIEHLFTKCGKVEPCKKTCNGVAEKWQDFEMRHLLSRFTGASAPEESIDLCKSFGHLEKCSEKPECKDFLSSNVGWFKEEMDKRCEVVNDPCYLKVAKTCEKESDAFFGKESDAWDAKSCTDRFYPWSGKQPEKELSKCCGKFGSLTSCAKTLKCEQTLEKYMHITPSPNWPAGKAVACTCVSEWEQAFGGKACP